MFKKSILFISILFTLIFQGCSSGEDSNVNDMVSSNEYVLTGLDKKQYIVKKEGEGFVLDGAEGKVVIFDIFATWCPPCRAAAPHLTSLQEKYKDDLVIIGITIEDGILDEKLQEFKKEYNAEYIIVNSKQNRPLCNAIATELELGDRYPIPTMALYKDGKLINYFVGATEEEFVESDIKRALDI
ncbi:TlpA disulfide reductase family protein [Sulfurimonas sp.]|uniref:TlpA family protein disulfide reductase n=1 Tax=Sulfurimonas sp. TaxID=2022749 RepID=UPI0026110FA1|nr:TlpA disulfide reductase family protein [Sulfurimonas sp.]